MWKCCAPTNIHLPLPLVKLIASISPVVNGSPVCGQDDANNYLSKDRENSLIKKRDKRRSGKDRSLLGAVFLCEALHHTEITGVHSRLRLMAAIVARSPKACDEDRLTNEIVIAPFVLIVMNCILYSAIAVV
jgi:hypothetical protein